MKTKNNTTSKNQKSHGQLTVETAQSLESEGYDVLYDHGPSSENVGRIVSHFSDKNERGTQLSYLDIAILKKNTQKVIAFVEIEETMDKPKTMIADIFGFLMGEKIDFKGTALEVGRRTTLIVAGFNQAEVKKHNQYILEKVKKMKSVLDTKNSKIGKIVIEPYSDKDDLINKLKSHL